MWLINYFGLYCTFCFYICNLSAADYMFLMVLAMGSSVSVFLHLFAEDIYVQVGAKGRCQKWVLKKVLLV